MNPPPAEARQLAPPGEQDEAKIRRRRACEGLFAFCQALEDAPLFAAASDRHPSPETPRPSARPPTAFSHMKIRQGRLGLAIYRDGWSFLGALRNPGAVGNRWNLKGHGGQNKR